MSPQEQRMFHTIELATRRTDLKLLHFGKDDKPIEQNRSNGVDQQCSESPDFSPFAYQQSLLKKETEPFPDFQDNWDEWIKSEGNEALDEPGLPHCDMHCQQLVCRANQESFGKAKSQNWVCQCNTATTLGNEYLGLERFITNMNKEDMNTARELYQDADEEDTVTFDLSSSLALVRKLIRLDILNIRAYLRKCPYYRPSALINCNHYFDATSDAHDLTQKLFDYFETSLRGLPDRTRSVPVQVLEAEMQACMRAEVLWWMTRWCIPESYKPRVAFGTAMLIYLRKQHGRGIQALLNGVEKMVRDFVAGLMWLEYKRYGGDGESETSDTD